MTPADKALIAQIVAELGAPFPESEIEWKKDYGSPLPYISARAVMDRLDAVVPGLWSVEFEPAEMRFKRNAKKGDKLTHPESEAMLDADSKAKANIWDVEYGVRCTITINIPGVGPVSRSDAAECGNFAPLKAAHSNALKRAAVQWGIGRYLYFLDNAEPGKFPSWALPGGGGRPKTAESTELDTSAKVAPIDQVRARIEAAQNISQLRAVKEFIVANKIPLEPADVNRYNERNKELTK